MVIESPCPRCGTIVNTYRNPFPTADLIVIRQSKVLLIERKNPPPGWALPGGFIDYGESAEEAAARELKEETGLNCESLSLFGVYSRPGRDPRFHTLTVVYRCEATGELSPGDDAARAEWFDRLDLPELMAFDHREIIEACFETRT